MGRLNGLNLEQLISLVKKHKVACFGLGIQGRRMADFFSNWNIQEQLVAYIDNNKAKIGDFYSHDGYKYPVYSFDEAHQALDENVVILITCLDYNEIYKQLESDVIRKWDYIAFAEVSDNELISSNYHEVIKETINPVIPKKIHYVWLGGKKTLLINENIKQIHI